MLRAQKPILVNSAQLSTWKEEGRSYAFCTGILLGTLEKDDCRCCQRPPRFDHPLLLVAKKGEVWERIGIAYLVESLSMHSWRQKQKPVEKWLRDWLQLKRDVMYLG